MLCAYCLLQVVLEVLLSAAAAGRRFHVIVLDSRPELEGRQMLRRLLQVRPMHKHLWQQMLASGSLMLLVPATPGICSGCQCSYPIASS